MSNRLVLIITVAVSILFGIGVYRMPQAKAAAAEPVSVQEIWHDNTLAIFDANVGGGCHLYIVRGRDGVGFSTATPAAVAGPGCRQ
jgi:hypothetical protein